MTTHTTTTHMNDHDIQDAVFRFGLCAPNRAHVARVVRNLSMWANENSDGWAYWPKPARAAAKAMEQIQSTTSMENVLQEQKDLTRAEALTAVRPIRAFLTRQGVDRQLADHIMAG